MSDLLNRAASLMLVRELELRAKGYPPGISNKAVERARGTAEYKTQAVGAAIREQAFLDTLEAELATAEEWINRQLMFLRGELAETA